MVTKTSTSKEQSKKTFKKNCTRNTATLPQSRKGELKKVHKTFNLPGSQTVLNVMLCFISEAILVEHIEKTHPESVLQVNKEADNNVKLVFLTNN